MRLTNLLLSCWCGVLLAASVQGAAGALPHPLARQAVKPMRANVFVAPTGSDTGPNCRRFASPTLFPSSRNTVCLTLQRAYTLASCGDDVLVGAGLYSDEGRLSYSARKDSCSSSTRVKFNVVSGGSVSMPALEIKGAQHVYLSGSRGSWTTTGASRGVEIVSDQAYYQCDSSGHVARDAVFDHLTIHIFKIICSQPPVNGRFSDITLRNSDLGNQDACISPGEDLISLFHTANITVKNNYIHDLSVGACGDPHADCIQIAGDNTNTVIDGNVFVRCWDDGIFAKGDFGAINGLTIQNNSFGGPLVRNPGTANSAIATGCPAERISDVTIRNNSFVDSNSNTGGCGIVPGLRITNNLFGSASQLNDAGGGVIDYNVFQGPSGAGKHWMGNARPNWVNPTPAASRKPDLRIGRGSRGIINTGSPASRDYARSDADGTSRPLGSKSDPGAYESPLPSPWKSCIQFNARYPHGLGRVGARDRTTGVLVRKFTRSNRLYRLAMMYNTGLDSDRDGIACEKR